MGEKAIEAKVVRWARNKGWLVWKMTSPGTLGVPDRIFISPLGVVAFIEFKAPGKKPTSIQQYMLERLGTSKVPADWFDDADQAIEWLGRL